jgi:hypothetical protein
MTMAPKIRCKFRLDSITKDSSGTDRFKFSAVCAATGAIPEDELFTKYTPYGTLEVGINNPGAVAQLKIGESYYLDLTPAE